MDLSPVEKNIFDDLLQDTHELWEWYAFIRYSHSDVSEDEVIRLGNDLLATWVNRGWLDASKSRTDRGHLSGDELLSIVEKLGPQATDPRMGVILLDLTPSALKATALAPSMQQGKRYTNPDALGEVVRTQSGFPTANDPVRRGPYAKISKGGKVTYTPLAGNPTLGTSTGNS